MIEWQGPSARLCSKDGRTTLVPRFCCLLRLPSIIYFFSELFLHRVALAAQQLSVTYGTSSCVICGIVIFVLLIIVRRSPSPSHRDSVIDSRVRVILNYSLQGARRWNDWGLASHQCARSWNDCVPASPLGPGAEMTKTSPGFSVPEAKRTDSLRLPRYQKLTWLSLRESLGYRVLERLCPRESPGYHKLKWLSPFCLLLKYARTHSFSFSFFLCITFTFRLNS